MLAKKYLGSSGWKNHYQQGGWKNHHHHHHDHHNHQHQGGWRNDVNVVGLDSTFLEDVNSTADEVDLSLSDYAYIDNITKCKWILAIACQEAQTFRLYPDIFAAPVFPRQLRVYTI